MFHRKTHQNVYRASYVCGIWDKKLRGLNSGLYFQTYKVLLFGEVLVLKPKKTTTVFSETSFVVPHKSLRRFCPRIVAMQAVSGRRKDCDSLFLPNEVPCVNVVYIGRYFVHGIFPEYSSLYTQYALKWTEIS